MFGSKTDPVKEVMFEIRLAGKNLHHWGTLGVGEAKLTTEAQPRRVMPKDIITEEKAPPLQCILGAKHISQANIRYDRAS